MTKMAYHHGELRQALIDATRELVRERGEAFSLADACRRAGVSTAAPYRHFADKDEIINEVVAQGFADMASRARAVASDHPTGSVARIIAVGRDYMAFAVNEPTLFRIMFTQRPGLTDENIASLNGKECFRFVVQEVVDFCTANGIAGDAMQIALQLWTLVHGAASLTIDGDYDKIAPRIDVDALVVSGAQRLLSGGTN